MAISETMSNFSDWMQLYQNNFSITQADQIPPTTTTTTTTVTTANNSTAVDSSRNNINLSPDHGRISKPIRRRSRASRRTPTTLLNTDITNFRAMVQQFTGGPSARTHLPNGGATSSFGVGTQRISPNPAMTPASGFFIQYPNQLQQQQQQQQVFMSSVQNMQLDRSGSGGVSSHAPPQGSSSSNDQDRDFNNYML